METVIPKLLFSCVIAGVVVCLTLYIGQAQESYSPQYSRNQPMQNVYSISNRTLHVAKEGNNGIKLLQTEYCQWSTFRKYFVTSGYFPSSGNWEFNGQSEGRFLPDMCHFAHFNFADLGKCIMNKKWTSIITMGDSNGYRYHAGLLYWLDNLPNSSCTLLRTESQGDFKPDFRYYNRERNIPDKAFQVTGRGCRSCNSRYVHCNIIEESKNRSFVLEHLASVQVNDTTVTTQKFGNVPETKSAQEFQFKIYLKTHYPDILILAMPFVHERETPMAEAKKRITGLANLVKKLIPRKVKVVWLPMLKTWRFDKPIYEGLTADQKDLVLNQELFKVLRPMITDAHSNWYGFYDLRALTSDLHFLSSDNVHFHLIVYKELMKHLLLLMCQE